MVRKLLESNQKRQFRRIHKTPNATAEAPVQFEAAIPNPKFKLLGRVREVMRLRYYAIRALDDFAALND